MNEKILLSHTIEFPEDGIYLVGLHGPTYSIVKFEPDHIKELSRTIVEKYLDYICRRLEPEVH